MALIALSAELSSTEQMRTQCRRSLRAVLGATTLARMVRWTQSCARHACSCLISTHFQRAWSNPVCTAVAFGKGVYFARDANYSLQKLYSKPNSEGWQHLFVCRLVIGEYCLGTNGQLRPNIRQGDLPFDSFVNNISNPSIFVATDDAQACKSKLTFRVPPKAM